MAGLRASTAAAAAAPTCAINIVEDMRVPSAPTVAKIN
jgi:hypothetical protein